MEAELLLLSEHINTVSLRPNDFDWSLQLNNSVYLEVLEIGRWEWCLSNNIDLRYHHLIGVVVRLEIDYIKPIFWNPIAKLNVRTKVSKIEHYSLYLQQTIEELSAEIVATAMLRLSLFHKERKIPVPINIKELKQLQVKTR